MVCRAVLLKLNATKAENALHLIADDWSLLQVWMTFQTSFWHVDGCLQQSIKALIVNSQYHSTCSVRTMVLWGNKTIINKPQVPSFIFASYLQLITHQFICSHGFGKYPLVELEEKGFKRSM